MTLVDTFTAHVVQLGDTYYMRCEKEGCVRWNEVSFRGVTTFLYAVEWPESHELEDLYAELVSQEVVK